MRLFSKPQSYYAMKICIVDDIDASLRHLANLTKFAFSVDTKDICHVLTTFAVINLEVHTGSDSLIERNAEMRVYDDGKRYIHAFVQNHNLKTRDIFHAYNSLRVQVMHFTPTCLR